MKYFSLLLAIFAGNACKPANQSFENWSKTSSSYLVVSMKENNLGWQYDFWYQGKQLEAGSYQAYIQSLGNSQESIEGTLSMKGTMSATNPRFAINVYTDKYNCSASHKTLVGVIPLICTDDKIDRLVLENQGDCKASNSKISLDGKPYEAEFSEKKEIEILINTNKDNFSVFEQMVSVSASSGSEGSATSIVDYNVFEEGKLVTPSFIVRKEGGRQLLYLIQADIKDATAPTYLLAEIDGNQKPIQEFQNGSKAYRTTLKKNICLGKLKNRSDSSGGSFLFLPSVSQK